tara:strand:- start:308 stop:535 length:228 start_codon:yes stop_codon:yes gene_type:complete
MEAKVITVQDLAGVVSIIDVCSQRGAFRGEELAGVGRVREVLLAEVQAQQAEAPAAPAAVDVPAVETDETEESSK